MHVGADDHSHLIIDPAQRLVHTAAQGGRAPGPYECEIRYRRARTWNATTDGVVRAPSVFSITLAVLPSIIATQEFVVPRSMPMMSPAGPLEDRERRAAALAAAAHSGEGATEEAEGPARICASWRCGYFGVVFTGEGRGHKINSRRQSYLFRRSVYVCSRHTG